MMILTENGEAVLPGQSPDPDIVRGYRGSRPTQLRADVRVMLDGDEIGIEDLNPGQEMGANPVLELISINGLTQSIGELTEGYESHRQSVGGVELPDELTVFLSESRDGVGVQDQSHISASTARKSDAPNTSSNACEAPSDIDGSDAAHSAREISFRGFSSSILSRDSSKNLPRVLPWSAARAFALRYKSSRTCIVVFMLHLYGNSIKMARRCSTRPPDAPRGFLL